MTTAASAPPNTRIQRRTFNGKGVARYVCACGYTGAWFPDTPTSSGELQERDEMAAHLAAAHPDFAGRCARCDRPTDHFRARTALGDLWLCETHSPAVGGL